MRFAIVACLGGFVEKTGFWSCTGAEKDFSPIISNIWDKFENFFS